MPCLFPGCQEPARNKLAIRCRKPSTLNVWSPDSKAYLCKKHAEGGVSLTVDVQPTTDQNVTVAYTSGGQQIGTRTTPIQRAAA